MKFIRKISCVAAVIGLASTQVFAEGLNASDLDFAFSGNEEITHDQGSILFAPMTETEMLATEGEVAPLIYAAAVVGARVIATRVVSKRVATSIVKNGGNVITKSRSQARSIARNAGNGNAKPIREIHRNRGSGNSHYHTSSHGRGHAIYGRSRN